MLIALWRISAPVVPAADTPSPPQALEPLTKIAEVLVDNSIGRRASLEGVIVREVPSPRTMWIGSEDDRVFAVLDPDVKNLSSIAVKPGAELTLIGLVRATPPEETVIRQWAIDAATAKAARERGTYLYVTEIRGPRPKA